MKKLLEYLVKNIVQNPEKVTVEEKPESDYLNLILKAHPEDLKIIIGKEGRTIRAIRELVKIKALQEGKRVNIKIEG